MTWKIGGIVKRTPEEKERISRKIEESTRRAVEKGIRPVYGSSPLHWELWRERMKREDEG